MRCLWLGGLVVLLAGGVAAAPQEVAGSVLGLDGKPAPGVQVTVRTCDAERHFAGDVVLTTDADGKFKAQVDVPAATRPLGRADQRVQFIVRAPGSALGLGSPPPGRLPIQLKPAYTVTGRLVGPDGQPVTGATVTVNALGTPWDTVLVNVPEYGFSLPELVTRSGEDGMFALTGYDTMLRGGSLYAQGGFARISVVAEVGGQRLLGSHSGFVVSPPRPDRAELSLQQRTIRLAPALGLTGVCVDTHGQPVAGATVRLHGMTTSAGLVQPATTGPDGRFRLSSAPRGDHLFVMATHPELASAWQEVTHRGPRGEAMEAEEPQEARLTLRPFATVTGKLVDPLPNAPPLEFASLGTVFDAGYNDGSIAVGRGYTKGKVEPDGSFSIRMVVGSGQIRADALGYAGRSGPMAVPALGLGGVVIEMKRAKGFLFHFVSADPARLEGAEIRVRVPHGVETSHGNVHIGWWFLAPQPWVDDVDLRLVGMQPEVSGKELLPWTHFTYNAEVWPIEIRVD